MNRILTSVLLLLTALTLGACSLLTQRAPLTVYAPTLTRADAANDSVPVSPPRQLLVAQPLAIAPLDGLRIVVLPARGELQFYQGARWQDTAPAMLQDLLLQAFQQVPGLGGAATLSGGVRSDFVLRSDLHAFQSEYRGEAAPVAIIRVTFQLVRSADASVVAARDFTFEQGSASAQLPDVIAAFQLALDELVRQVVPWIVEMLNEQGSEGTSRR